MYRKPVIELIRSRSSWRGYTPEQLAPELRTRIRDALATSGKGPFGNTARFSLLTREEVKDLDKIRLGTYGVIRGAHSFIAGAISSSRFCFEDYGYLLEKIILFLTELGLGTCWMGGTFNRSGFALAMGKNDKEIIPAVTPVGHPTTRRVLRDRILRFGAGSKARKPWAELFSLGDFSRPLSEADAGKYALPLEMVRLGPSASNRQPWRIVKESEQDSFHFILERTKGYFKTYQGSDFQKIDMGIAMCHFELSARDLGLPGRWETRNPGLSLRKGMEYTVSWIPE